MVACECFGAYGTRSRVVHVVGFRGGPKFEANVRRLDHSATGPHRSAALVGSQSRRTTPIRNPRVPGVLDRLDV